MGPRPTLPRPLKCDCLPNTPQLPRFRKAIKHERLVCNSTHFGRYFLFDRFPPDILRIHKRAHATIQSFLCHLCIGRPAIANYHKKGSNLQAEFDVGFANVRVPSGRELGLFRSMVLAVLEESPNASAIKRKCPQRYKRSPRYGPHSPRGFRFSNLMCAI